MLRDFAIMIFLLMQINLYGQPTSQLVADATFSELKEHLDEATSDAEKINAHLGIVDRFIQDNPGTARKHLHVIDSLVKQGGYHDKDGYILHYEASLIILKGKSKEALDKLESAERIALAQEDNQLKGLICIQRAKVYIRQDRLALAMEEALKADGIYSSLEDYRGLAEVRNSLGSIDYHREHFQSARKYLLEARDLYQKAGFLEGVAKSNLNLGVICKELGEYDLSYAHNQSALSYYRPQNKTIEQVYILNNLGYLEIGRKRYQQAKEYLEEALELNNIPQHKIIKVSILEHFGEVHFFLGTPQIAFKFFNEAYELADSMKLDAKKLDIARHMMKAMDSLGNSKEALSWMQIAFELQDSINHHNQTEELAQLQVQFRLKEQEEENIRLKAEKDIQQLKNIAITLGMILISVMTAMLFIGFKRKIRLNKILASQQTSIQKQNHQLQQQNKSLEAINQEKNMMMGMLAHDIRDPLAKIEGLSNILLDQNQLLPQQHKFIGHIKDTAQTLSSMSQRLLDLEALEAGKLKLEIAPTDYNRIVKDSIHAYEDRRMRKKVNIGLVPSAEGGMALIDADALRQVMDNLISNALKFSPARTTITVYTSASEKEICIQVVDEGPGIPEEDIPKLFNKFQTLTNRPTGGEKSTGLGLALTQKYVDAMKGRIQCESTVGEGTTFSVFLPKSLQVSA